MDSSRAYKENADRTINEVFKSVMLLKTFATGVLLMQYARYLGFSSTQFVLQVPHPLQ